MSTMKLKQNSSCLVKGSLAVFPEGLLISIVALVVAVVSQLIIEQRSRRSPCWYQLRSSFVSNDRISASVQCSIGFDRSRLSRLSNAVLSVEDRLDSIAIRRRWRNCFLYIVAESYSLARRLHHNTTGSMFAAGFRNSFPAVNIAEYHLKRFKRRN